MPAAPTMAGTPDNQPGPSAASGGGSAPALVLAGVAAVLASSCCVLPLLLVLVGVSGAWMSRLRWLEPYSPALTALALVCLGVAAWRLRRPAVEGAACAVGDGVCRDVSTAARRWFWLVALLALLPLAMPFVAPLFY